MKEHGFVRPVALLGTVALLIAIVLSFNRVLAAPPSVSLEQCRNGTVDSPNACEDIGAGSGWVAGNAGGSQAHLREGYSIPYRLIATDLPAATTIEIVVGYNIKHSDKSALDFRTHYERFEPHAQFGRNGRVLRRLVQ